MPIYLAYPTEYQQKPSFPYKVLDYPPSFPRWGNEIFIPKYDDPEHVADYIVKEKSIKPSVIIPLCEEGVLASGITSSRLNLKHGVLRDQAFICSNKLLQRMMLPKEFNPLRWFVHNENEPITFEPPFVVKSTSSILGQGVRIVNNKYAIENAVKQIKKKAFKEITRFKNAGGQSSILIESFIGGDHYEVNGIAINGKVKHFFNTLSHECKENKIINYQIADVKVRKELEPITRRIVNIFNLDYCGFCIEYKGPPWKVLEVHCRLGEDKPPYDSLLSHPQQYTLDVMLELFNKEIS